jgi:hypothetical protein
VIPALPDVPLISASFGLEDRWLLWSRVRLYPDRLVLRAWSIRGRLRRQVCLREVEGTDHQDGWLLLDLEGDERMRLAVEEAPRWAEFVASQREIRRDDGG